ncbi:MAG: type II secretion system F family protein [Burkholderiales bacterium]|jgi:type IV pilus assembly protein PilC|nr:type II secretion system F family protein [Burkholderiales bacterium]MBP6250566.1 type II secretion system F family protein [Leptothrix sp. (in: b-proteobacteria)]MBP7519369.1 type II secretion system F family protein [Leptothrix sp. (in: b-proteobacteria)]HQY07793.1 type II secretion system F family protein [Burkholderiaceae bacterium]
MATAAAKKVKEFIFEWEGKDRNGKAVRGEMRSGGEAAVSASLRRQGILVNKVKKRRSSGGKSIKGKDIAVFTRQLATMLKAGVPLLQAFDIVARGSPNPRLTRMLTDIRSDVETGTSLSGAFRKHPLQFDALYCNLVEAGEAAGILETLLERLAHYQEKTIELQNKIRSALIYPISVLVVAFIVVAVIMIFVIPSFKDIFKSFGADLPAPTLVVIAMSEFFVEYWLLIFGGLGFGIYMLIQSWRRSPKLQMTMDRVMLKLPIFGPLIHKAAVARWSRTLSTMFAAGVPLVEALDSVGGAAGNAVFSAATEQIQRDVATGSGLTSSMQASGVFPNMVLQMSAIGEESGSLDQMLSKVADFYEQEVDEAVKGLSTLMEPIIIVVLGTIIGGIVVSMYLPIFKLGQVV